MERFVIIANGWKPLTFITKRSILDVAAALDPSINLKKSFYGRDLLLIHLTRLCPKQKNFIWFVYKFKIEFKTIWTRSLVVSDLRSETRDWQFFSGWWLYAEVSSLLQWPG